MTEKNKLFMAEKTKKIIKKTIIRIIPISIGAILSIPVGVLSGAKLTSCLMGATLTIMLFFIFFMVKYSREGK